VSKNYFIKYRNFFCSSIQPNLLTNSKNTSNTNKLNDLIKYYNIHGYCTQCNYTSNFQINKTCKYFDSNYCSNNCEYTNFNDSICVYFYDYPVCYIKSLNIFLRHYDFLHVVIYFNY
jgi:hypothetical protein